MAGVEMSPAKHKADSAKLRQQRTMRSRIDQQARPVKRAAKPAVTVEEFQAQGGVVEVVPCTWSAPTRYPRPTFAKGKGGIG